MQVTGWGTPAWGAAACRPLGPESSLCCGRPRGSRVLGGCLPS